jgi:DNA-binding NarL/FixJ family response regulator
VEVATTSCPAALQRAAGAGRADVLLVNPALWADDWQRLEDLPARCHRAAVGVLAESPSRKNLERAVRYGFDAYLEKRSLTPLLLASVVRTLLGGGCAYLTTEQGARVPELSAREVEVLRLLRDGCSVREIATCLYLGERTIKAAINSAARRLGAHNRAHAVALGYGLGLLAPSERHAGPILRG